MDASVVTATSFKYRAFISYSHRDRKRAEWLHKAIERYRVPNTLVGQPGRDGPIPDIPGFPRPRRAPGAGELRQSDRGM